jgi:hypothetical protein
MEPSLRGVVRQGEAAVAGRASRRRGPVTHPRGHDPSRGAAWSAHLFGSSPKNAWCDAAFPQSGPTVPSRIRWCRWRTPDGRGVHARERCARRSSRRSCAGVRAEFDAQLTVLPSPDDPPFGNQPAGALTPSHLGSVPGPRAGPAHQDVRSQGSAQRSVMPSRWTTSEPGCSRAHRCCAARHSQGVCWRPIVAVVGPQEKGGPLGFRIGVAVHQIRQHAPGAVGSPARGRARGHPPEDLQIRPRHAG